MLNEQQTTVLSALVDTIIPPDDYPSGWESGVGNYLLRQFERDLVSFVGMYQQGLLALDAEAKETTGGNFAELTPEAREALLLTVEQGRVHTVWSIDPAVFFARVVEHCAEGFYSDPDNAGNQDKVAWNMIGFEVTG